MLSLVHAVAGRPWAIRGELAAHVRGLVAKEGLAGLRHLAEVKAEVHAVDARRGQRSTTRDETAVIPVIGSMTQRGDVIGSEPTRSTDAVAAEVLAAANDSRVGSIVLEFDSPGGEVYGVPEAAVAIREARKAKPIVASVNSVAASAAYYLASQATEVVVTPSGEVGSIGVYLLHVDESAAIEAEGLKLSFISAGKYKVEGNFAEPLSDEARAQLQSVVDDFYGMFVADVARGRNVNVETVRNGFGEGRLVRAKAAVSMGMADSVGTLDDAMRRARGLARRGNPAATARAQVEAAQARQRVGG